MYHYFKAHVKDTIRLKEYFNLCNIKENILIMKVTRFMKTNNLIMNNLNFYKK